MFVARQITAYSFQYRERNKYMHAILRIFCAIASSFLLLLELFAEHCLAGASLPVLIVNQAKTTENITTIGYSVIMCFSAVRIIHKMKYGIEPAFCHTLMKLSIRK